MLSVRQNSVGTGLRIRVGLLSFIIVITVAVVVFLMSIVALDNAGAELEEISVETAKEFDFYLLGAEHELLIASNTLPYTSEPGIILRRLLNQSPAIFEVQVVTPDNQILYERRRSGSINASQINAQPWLPIVQQNQTYWSHVDTQTFGVPFITLAVPVFDADRENFEGSLVARIDLTSLWDEIRSVQVGRTGYAYLVDMNGQLLAYRDMTLVQSDQNLQDLIGTAPQEVVTPRTINVYIGLIEGMVLSGASQMNTVSWAAIVEMPIGEPISNFSVMLLLFSLLLVAAFLLVYSIMRYIQTRLVVPLVTLREGVEQFGQGKFSHRVPPLGSEGDEIAVLTGTFNQMSAQLEDMIDHLEERVFNRTRDLAIAADVAKQITTVLDVRELLQKVVHTTALSFDFYAVSVFLLDEDQKVLRLVAGADKLGLPFASDIQTELPLDTRPSLIAQAARNGEAVIINDVQLSDAFMPVAQLAETRSEAALPLKLGKRLIGVFNIQSEFINRFGSEDLTVISTLAEQISIAIRNAQLYEQSKAAYQEAERANKLKSQFLATMSHELRTPLNAILNFTQFVSSGMLGKVNPQQIDALDKTVSNAEHLLNLINDILDISKIEAGAFQLFVQRDIDVAKELQLVAATGQSLLDDKPVQLKLNIEPDLPKILGDRQRVYQIVLNLVSNACKFTEKGLITVTAHREDGNILIQVQDSGPGVAPEEQALIFETFGQTTTGMQKGGTGLGLPISRRLAEAHGGRLWVESMPGCGATFCVLLPLQSPRLKPTLEN